MSVFLFVSVALIQIPFLFYNSGPRLITRGKWSKGLSRTGIQLECVVALES